MFAILCVTSSHHHLVFFAGLSIFTGDFIAMYVLVDAHLAVLM